MIKNVLVKVGERIEVRERIVPAVYDESGEVKSPEHVENYEAIVPIMQAQNVEMSAEEVAEMERMQAEITEQEMTTEERVDNLEAATDDIILMMADLIGGV